MPEGIPAEFDPKKYRDELADQIKATKKEGQEKLQTARESRDKRQVYDAMWETAMKKREKIELARWNEEYYRAKLLTHGNFVRNEAGEMVENESGLTPNQLASRARLVDSFGYNIEHVLEAIDKTGLKPENLRSRKLLKEARWLFQTEAHHRPKEFIGNPDKVRRFVEIFGLQDDLNQAVSSQLDACVANSYREGSEKLLKAYPLFDKEEYRRRLLARSYPVPEGLNAAKPEQSLFSEALLGGEDGKGVSLDRVAVELSGKTELLANDFRTIPGFYWSLKNITDDMDMRGSREVSNWLIRREKLLEKTNEDRIFVKAMYMFDELGENGNGWKSRAYVDNPERLELHFSADKEQIHKENEWNRLFATPNTFRFEGAFLGNEALFSSFGREKTGFLVRVDGGDKDFGRLANLSVDVASLRALAESVKVKEKDFSRSIEALQKLGQENGLPEVEISDLITAIKEFGTYMYDVESSSVGDCLTIPREFNNFVSRKFGIELDGARYGEYHPEWGSSMGYDPFTFYHEVSVYAHQLVFDWTVTQYSRHSEKPIPHVYKIGDERKGFGPLYRLHGEPGDRRPNVLYIDDPNEPPIEYGY